jgi:hypothetical protein
MPMWWMCEYRVNNHKSRILVNLKQNTEKAVAGSDQQTVQKVAKKKEL